MISSEKVLHIAKLARIELSSQEVEKFQRELSLILDWIKKLEEVNVDNTEPAFHSIEIENEMREDKIEGNESVREAIKSLFPQREKDFLRVKAVLQRE